jgi:hypothetical protein
VRPPRPPPQPVYALGSPVAIALPWDDGGHRASPACGHAPAALRARANHRDRSAGGCGSGSCLCARQGICPRGTACLCEAPGCTLRGCHSYERSWGYRKMLTSSTPGG